MIKTITIGRIRNVFNRRAVRLLLEYHRRFRGKSITKIAMVCVVGLLFTWQAVWAGDLTVEVIDIVLEKGDLRIALCDTQTAFEQRQCSLTRRVKPKIPGVRVEFLDLPKSSYAVLIHQDLNENGILDKSFFGVPEEPIGFSNNPRIQFGPPDFTDTLVSIPSNKEISITLRND